MATTELAGSQVAVCLALTQAISRTRTVEEIYDIALDALGQGLNVVRASVLLFGADGVMRFKAYRGLSDAYRRAVEGHTPWSPDSPDPVPISVADVHADPSLAGLSGVFEAERIAAMAFIPLVSHGKVIGKFMLYYDLPHEHDPEELQLASVIASQVAFAVERTRTQEQARRSEERLRFALNAADMGTWDWDLQTQQVRWSENLEQLHGVPPGTFDGTFGSYEREIHPDDRHRVLTSARRAITEGVPHDVEYRIVAPDGTVRWVEGKGRVEHEHGRPVRMTGVCMIVTRRKEAELARLAAAEEASRLKDEFLATLSHELRTPLNAMLGWIQMVRRGTLSAARTADAIDIIGRNAMQQARLIEDILDVSRIIAGKLEIEHLPMDVGSLVDDVVAGLLPEAESKQIVLSKQVADDLPPLEADPKRLRQIFDNIVSNAIKFTPAGGHVEVRCWRADHGWLDFAVTDSGPGIAPEFLPHVFDPFRQGDSRATRRHGGLGLGLAIARHLVELHDGRIQACSTGGCGTTISVRLPVRPDAASTNVRAVVAPSGAGAGNLRLDGSTVLVVDDQRDSRELLAALFDQRGARVVQCDGAASALEALERGSIQLLVADIAMPEVDGYDLIRQVRERHLQLPAVAVSAYARPQDRGLAFASGFNGYCAKPIEADEFFQTVRSVMRTT